MGSDRGNRRSGNIVYIGDSLGGSRVTSYTYRWDEEEGCEKEFWGVDQGRKELFIRCGNIQANRKNGRVE